MKREGYYPKIIEHFASRNFNQGDRVKAYFKGGWVHGTIVKKYKKKEGKPPYILVRTDKKVDDDSDALLGGFGLEGKVGGPQRTILHSKSTYLKLDLTVTIFNNKIYKPI
ncbi:hypothetical protein J4229_03965 [Candidatus Pacearchaeota archaeon]|nr:hypothetical protein [Candidatus Pacearchaeota archaeon]